MTDEDAGESFADGGSAGPVPGLLCDVLALASAPDTAATGALWKLAESGRQLDANLIHLQAGRQVGTHTEPDLDVLLLVVSGSGTLTSPEGDRQLTAGSLYWLPHGSTRSLTAGDGGLSYLTVHRRRPGMQIRSRPRPESA
ncbi:cupin domain-containing protein [Streptacidiphilus melanogenes]|uniref:cupin domain-containing protein n=1 Tax=Streptacidiphilus melanogenes TaxID=411235 RepID=UPI0005AA92CF|nr:cupin domain-containing protein [Streptacidiphilus melanogenes]